MSSVNLKLTSNIVGGCAKFAFHHLLRNSLLCQKQKPFAPITQFLSSCRNNQLYQVKPSLLGLRRFSSTMGDSESKKAELKKRLTPLQYHVTQEKGTERAFTGKYNKTTAIGIYHCIVCGEPLFTSETKFESGCGWPAFNDVIDQGKVKLTKDTSNVGANLLLLIANPGMIRTEVQCSHCDAHLGHVFDDGPPPKRKRFCINSASLDFHPFGEKKEGS